jgi:hypothetical protein
VRLGRDSVTDDVLLALVVETDAVYDGVFDSVRERLPPLLELEGEIVDVALVVVEAERLKETIRDGDTETEMLPVAMEGLHDALSVWDAETVGDTV